jgi:hypothetical protein
MRERLNDNPVMTAALVAIVGVVIAFVFLTRMSGSSAESTPAATATTTPATGAVAPAATPTTPTPVETTPVVAPSGSVSPTPAGGTAKFVAGPGLPKAIVKAYNGDKIVVLLVFKRNGIDDTAVRHYVDKLSAKNQDAAIFQTSAKHITKYSRIVVGVDVSQVPAIVVLEPNRGHINKDVSPQATVNYGFHGFGSIEQAIRNAQYNGPENLPAYPR